MAARTPHSSTLRTVVPALDNGPYLSRLSARSALYTDLTLLLNAAASNPNVPYRSLVIDQNCLAKSSDSNRRKTWSELKARYILEPNHPLFAAFVTEWALCTSDPERGLVAYCLLALNDKLVFDLAVLFLFPRLRRAPADLRPDDVQAFLTAAVATHPELRQWSAHTTAAVAQKYTASIRDFGLASGVVRKLTVRPALYGAPMRLLIRALYLVGTRDRDLVTSPAFKLMALDTGDIAGALSELNRQGALRFRMQGGIIELEPTRNP